MNKKTIASFILISTILFHCKKNEEPAPKPSVTLSVDGISKNAVFGSAVLAYEYQADHEGRAITITAKVGNDLLNIAIANWDFENPPKDGIKVKTYSNVFAEPSAAGTECLTVNSVVALCDGALVSYVVNSTELYQSGLFEGKYNGFIKVTSCDPSKKVISGEFDVKVDDGNGTNNIHILKGKFDNLTYIVAP